MGSRILNYKEDRLLENKIIFIWTLEKGKRIFCCMYLEFKKRKKLKLIQIAN